MYMYLATGFGLRQQRFVTKYGPLGAVNRPYFAIVNGRRMRASSLQKKIAPQNLCPQLLYNENIAAPNVVET